MKRLFVLLLAVAVLLGPAVPSVFAIAPLRAQFMETYKDSKIAQAAEEAKCDVCHYGKKKKDRNDFGVAVSKYFKKTDYDSLKDDKEKLKAAIETALKKAEAEKSVSGKTFAELIKEGKLPGTPPKEVEESE
ncbi:MAG: hypothetical protein FJ276_20070 [Planctomycetes bacterium]|nr:hypothetical protein [Planctomycetota bacterium]